MNHSVTSHIYSFLKCLWKSLLEKIKFGALAWYKLWPKHVLRHLN